MKKIFIQFAIFTGLIMMITPLSAQVLLKYPELEKTDTLVKQDKALNFIAMGDWGRNGADHQKQVAKQMGITAAATKAQFIVATGDNFYPSGVISPQDPLFRYSFEDIYTDFSLQWNWYPVLGNHDYLSNPDAEVAYSGISRRWKMPARYYAHKFSINGDSSQQVLIAFIDTNPLIPEFYANSTYGPNVRTQDSAKQKEWLSQVLSDPSPSVKWKIVVGHHPMYTGGSRTEGYDTKAIRRSLEPLFLAKGVDVYLTGHEHSLQHLTGKGKVQHFISGAASESTPSRLVEGSLLAASEYGFMLFSVQSHTLTVQVINDAGKVIYHTSLFK